MNLIFFFSDSHLAIAPALALDSRGLSIIQSVVMQSASGSQRNVYLNKCEHRRCASYGGDFMTIQSSLPSRLYDTPGTFASISHAALEAMAGAGHSPSGVSIHHHTYILCLLPLPPT